MDSTKNTSSPQAGQSSGTINLLTSGANGITYGIIEPATIKDQFPRMYRLCKKKDGDLVLQGAFYWQKGWELSGYEWEELETINE